VVYNIIELKKYKSYIRQTGTFLTQNTHRQLPLLWDVAVIVLRSFLALIPNGLLLDCDTIAVSGRYVEQKRVDRL
jgi:hypothetical protein